MLDDVAVLVAVPDVVALDDAADERVVVFVSVSLLRDPDPDSVELAFSVCSAAASSGESGSTWVHAPSVAASAIDAAAEGLGAAAPCAVRVAVSPWALYGGKGPRRRRAWATPAEAAYLHHVP